MWDMGPQPFPDAGQSFLTNGRLGVPEPLNHDHRGICIAGSLDCIFLGVGMLNREVLVHVTVHD